MAKYNKARLIESLRQALEAARVTWQQNEERQKARFDEWKLTAMGEYEALVSATTFERGPLHHRYGNHIQAIEAPSQASAGFNGKAWESAIAELELMNGEEVEINSRTSTNFLALATKA